jgi:glutamate 5-kinase
MVCYGKNKRGQHMTIVVKVGTSTVTHTSGAPNLRAIDRLARVMSDVSAAGHRIALVTSGAIGVGVSRMGMASRPETLHEKQAVAAVGQCALMHIYDQFFGEYSRKVAQILLSRADLEGAESRRSLENTFSTLFDYGVIPIVNENDSVNAEEIEGGHSRLFGDNDRLSAEVAVLVKAGLLVLFTDIDAVYDADPRRVPDAKPLPVITEITPRLREMAAGPGSKRGTGGMQTKLTAAGICLQNQIDMVVANGERPQTLYDILEGKPAGTLFTGKNV